MGFKILMLLFVIKHSDIYIPVGDPILRIRGFNDFLLRLQVAIPVVNTQMYNYIKCTLKFKNVTILPSKFLVGTTSFVNKRFLDAGTKSFPT
jgi:hypothetical protein